MPLSQKLQRGSFITPSFRRHPSSGRLQPTLRSPPLRPSAPVPVRSFSFSFSAPATTASPVVRTCPSAAALDGCSNRTPDGRLCGVQDGTSFVQRRHLAGWSRGNARSFSTSSAAAVPASVNDNPGVLPASATRRSVALGSGGDKLPVRERLRMQERKLLSDLHNILYPDKVPGSNDSGPPPEEEMFGWDVQGEDYIGEPGGAHHLQLGDLCELRTPGRTDMGMYLRPTRGVQRTSEFLTSSGLIIRGFPSRVLWYIPHHIDESLTKPFLEQFDKITNFSEEKGIPIEKVTVAPREHALPIIAEIKAFMQEASDCYTEKHARLRGLYDTFAHDTETVSLPVAKAARKIFGPDYTLAELHATHAHMFNSALQFRVDKGHHRETQTYRVRSKRDFEMIDKITAIIRGSTMGRLVKTQDNAVQVNALEKFIEKAKKVIDLSRKMRTEQPQRMPVERVEISDVPWDENDQCFINYIKERLKSYGLQPTPLEGLVPFILRLTERYDSAEHRFDADGAHVFLSEIGVFSPWENPSLQSEAAELSGYSSKRAQMEATFYDSLAKKPFEKLKFTDRLHGLRKDWGDMAVYCVDDANALEIDDGISVERASDTETWMHVHVANPTAYLPPDSTIAQVARRRCQTMYMHSTVFPLLPAPFGESLGVESGGPVLTFSAKVDNSSGEILEYDVQPGIVRNVKRITYTRLGEVLKLPPPSPGTHIQVGKFPELPGARRAAEAKVSATDLENLTLIHEAMLNRLRYRARNKAVYIGIGMLDYAIYDGYGSSLHPLTHPFPILYRGHPAARLSIINQSKLQDSPYAIVAEFMQMANNVAAKYTAKHHIPTIYRQCHYNTMRPDIMTFFENVIWPNVDEYGNIPDTVDTEAYLPYFFGLARTSATTKPNQPHVLIGVNDGYTRATSPLRRFIDMITHWNIQSHILGEQPVVPHSKIDELREEQNLRERALSYTMKDSGRFWTAAMVKRLLETGGRDMLPKNFTLRITELGEFPSHSTGICRELGTNAKIRWDNIKQWEQIGVGDLVNVEVCDAKLVDRTVYFKFLNVAQKAADTKMGDTRRKHEPGNSWTTSGQKFIEEMKDLGSTQAAR